MREQRVDHSRENGTLEAEDSRKGQIVNLRYFAGFTIPETAEALGVSVGTVEREWRYIRTWLRAELGWEGTEGLGN